MEKKNKKIVLNTEELRVDYHFHANLPRDQKKAEKHIKKYWEKLKEAGINVLLSTEHVYKNPKRAYEFLDKFKPENTYVIPGMEYVTKEGVDIIIFSRDKSIYDYEELFPLKMTLDETIDFVKNHNDLYIFVTHPYLKSKTGIVKNLGFSRFIDLINEVRAVEVVSGNALKQKIFKIYIEIFFKKKKKGDLLRIYLPNNEFYIERKEFYLKDLDFIAVGSDSHQFGEVGNCLILEYNESEDIFEKVINSKKGKIFVRPRQHTIYSLIKAPIIIGSEALIKKLYKFKIIRK